MAQRFRQSMLDIARSGRPRYPGPVAHKPGERIAVEKLPDGRIEVRAARAGGQISDAFGLLKREKGPRLSIEEMGEIAADSWAGKR